MHSWSLVSLHPRHVAPNGLQMLIPGMLRGGARRSMTALPTGLSLDFFFPLPLALGVGIKRRNSLVRLSMDL